MFSLWKTHNSLILVLDPYVNIEVPYQIDFRLVVQFSLIPHHLLVVFLLLLINIENFLVGRRQYVGFLMKKSVQPA